MTTTERRTRWCGTAEPPAFARWVADRAAGCGPHLAPVTRVGRCPDGHLVAEVLEPTTRALDETLDVLGVPTEGVAVTLAVPLLQLAARARAGALELGSVPTGGIGVDDSGAVLVADRPPGAEPACTETAPGGPSDRSPSPRDPDGARQLVLAARSVWDRVDARAPARAALDPALDAARDGDAAQVTAALDLVVAAAPPRPVRWTRPVTELIDDAVVPAAGPDPGDSTLRNLLRRSVRDVVDRGIPLGARRLPIRHALVGAVVAVGITTAVVSAL